MKFKDLITVAKGVRGARRISKTKASGWLAVLYGALTQIMDRGLLGEDPDSTLAMIVAAALVFLRSSIPQEQRISAHLFRGAKWEQATTEFPEDLPPANPG